MNISTNVASLGKTNSISVPSSTNAAPTKPMSSVTQKVMQNYIPAPTQNQGTVETRMSLSNNGNLIGTTISVKA